MTILLMSTSLKKQQRLSGRLADILSELYLLSAVLKRYKDDGYPDTDYIIVKQSMENGLHRIETDLQSAIANFPNRAVRPLLHLMIFPLGAWKKTASDTLSNEVAHLVSKSGPVRDRLSGNSYISNDPEDVTGRLEVALELANAVDPIYKKIRAATRAGTLTRKSEQIDDALEKNVISQAEAQTIKKAAAAAAKAVAVDSFEQDVYKNSSI
jgi:acyl-CoA dehydrogenase